MASFPLPNAERPESKRSGVGESWYMPRRPDRLLPRITVEAAHDGDAAPRVVVEPPAEAAGRP
jgi:hypothetical protein